MALEIVLPHFTHDLQKDAPPIGQMIHFICYHRDRNTYSLYSGVVTNVSGGNGTRTVTLGDNSCLYVEDGYRYTSKKFKNVVLPFDMGPKCNWSDQMLTLKIMAQQIVGDTVVGKDGSFGGSRKIRRRKSRKSRR